MTRSTAILGEMLAPLPQPLIEVLAPIAASLPPLLPNAWHERAQAEALAQGEVSAFSASLDWSRLAAREAEPEPLIQGQFVDRWFVSSIEPGQGILRVHGEAEDSELEHADEPTEAFFRYPCIAMDGTVTYRTLDNQCVAGDADVAWRLGKIREHWVVDSRGLRLAARVMLPEAAQQPGTSGLPSVSSSPTATTIRPRPSTCSA